MHVQYKIFKNNILYQNAEYETYYTSISSLQGKIFQGSMTSKLNLLVCEMFNHFKCCPSITVNVLLRTVKER